MIKLGGSIYVHYFYSVTFVLILICFVTNIDGDSGRGTWPNLRTMFEFKGETDNIVKFSCLLCLPKKNDSAFANSPSNLRQHVEVKTGSRPFHPASWILTNGIPAIILA